MQIAVDAKLTLTETRALQLMIGNPCATLTQLAGLLGISARTTQFHCSNVYAKLGVGNRKGLNVFLVAKGYNTAEEMAARFSDPSGAYILRLEAAIRAWARGDGHLLGGVADELA